MREIKFRAWDKTSNLMRTDITEICYNQDGSINQINVFSGSDILFPDKEAVLMQYTGLKDKNGVEIYEGDIILLGCSTNEAHYIPASIGWNDDRARFVKSFIPTTVIGGNPEREVSPGEMHSWVGMHDCLDRYYANKYHEVIGNIYENPELLEKQ